MEFNDHKEILEKDIVERYVLSHLSDDEEIAFEEHLLYCLKCREEVRKMEKIVFSVQQTESSRIVASGNKNLQVRKKIRAGKLLLKVAAGIVLLAGISSIIYYFSRNGKSITEDKKEQIVATQIDSVNSLSGEQERSIPEKIIDTIEIDSGDGKILPQKNKNLMAQAFLPNQIFENALENIARSGGVKIEIPKNSDTFRQNSQIEFKWKSDPTTDFVLAIFTNTGEILFEEPVSSPYIFKKELKPGLYYWQLETDLETFYTGKFIVQQ